MRQGLFISFEGSEGSGKSAQARELAAHFESRDLPVTLVREPGSTPLGDRVRDVLLFARDVPMTPEAQALLFSAARAELVRSVIRPKLAEGTHVVADRFFDSTLAYQGYGHGVDLGQLWAITRIAVNGTIPDITFLLDLPLEVALGRTRGRDGRWDRFESGDLEFHRRVREGYLLLAAQDPKRYVVVGADRAENEIAREVAERVDRALMTSTRS